MTMTQERLLALSTHKVLNVPMFAQGSNNSFFDGSTTSAADRNSHAIMTTQTVELVHVVSGKASATFDFTRRRVQLNTTAGAVEVIAVINFTTESQWSAIDESMTLLA